MKLFELSMPWYEFALGGGVASVLLLIMLRFTGKHSLGPNVALRNDRSRSDRRNAAVGNRRRRPIPDPTFIAVATILILDQSTAWLSSRSVLFNRIVEGNANALAKHGRLIPGAVQGHDIPEKRVIENCARCN